MIKQRKRNTATKILPKKQKRKNPDMEERAEEILSQFGKNIKFNYLNRGSYAKTYYFVIKNSKKLNPGEYVLKLFNDDPEDWLSDEKIEYLIKLSKYGLIPKIYYIDQTYVIMKYIRGENLNNIIKKFESNKNNTSLQKELTSILLKVKKLIQNWHKLGFIHGDIHAGNIIITESGKLYLIDPDLERLGLSTFNTDNSYFEELYARVNPYQKSYFHDYD